MKQMYFKALIIIGFLTLGTLTSVDAQPGPAGQGPTGGQPPAGGPPPCWPPPCIPIDGGVGFLIAAGLGLGGKKAFDLTKEKKSKKS